MIKHVIVYTGHALHPLHGPYRDIIDQRIAMFRQLNRFRIRPWTVEQSCGEHLVRTLRKKSPKEQLLVIPAGETSKLNEVFTQEETDYLKNDFLGKGGRGYFTCGSAYWASKRRIYKNQAPKTSKLALFHGIATGPLCPHPNTAGFYFDTVKVFDRERSCTVLLGGGGSFSSFSPDPSGQKVTSLARYVESELTRIGKQKEEQAKWEHAAIMVSHGEGASALLMFHPYYGKDDIDVEAYRHSFPDNISDWERIKQTLSPLDVRMRFIYDSVIRRLEEMDF